MKEDIIKNEKATKWLYPVLRIVMVLNAALMFFPAFNPAKISGLISKNMSLFTSGFSYNSLIAECGRAFTKGWVSESTFVLLFIASMLMCIGIAAAGAGGCMSLGNNKFKKLGSKFAIGGSVLQFIGLIGTYTAYTQVLSLERIDKVEPEFPKGFWLFLIMAVITLVLSIIIEVLLPKVSKEEKYAMESKYRLFLMFMPFAALAFVFCYLPLWGWRYAFFDYKSGGTLSMDNFVGFKWFKYLLQNDATKRDILRVLRNTLAMSGLGIATSWCAMAFAILLSEIKNLKFRRFVQTFTTIPNFISWVLVYAIAIAIFSSDGFINTFLNTITSTTHSANYLMGNSHTWLKMLAWGMWKGIGWSAIIYIAAISGIDQQLYEAATVDGAGRFQKMWHVTLPGLLPTYCVLLLMSIAGILSNGMDQYYVFSNATNVSSMEVLDLYTYNLGIGSGLIPLSTVVGMVKSVVSVILLFVANGISKLVRGESIV